ncbi:TRAP transporter substrate-binding protein DctP [Chloroflexota bacterium]
MKKLFLIPLIIVLVSGLMLSGCATPAPAPAPAPTPSPSPSPKPEPITLKFVHYLALDQTGVVPHLMYTEKVNEMAKGELVIDNVGGPEVTPPRELGGAVRSGAIDMAVLPPTFYRPLVLEGGAFSINRLPQKEQLPGTPFYDFAVEVHAKGGLRFLGEAAFANPFYTYCTKPIKSPDELKGLRFFSTPAFPFLEALGITPVNMDIAEIYSAVERGLIDGAPGKMDPVVKFSLYEVIKYVVGPPYWGTTSLVTIMNPDKWNKLPKHLQDILIQAKLEIQPAKEEQTKEVLETYWQTLMDGGMEHIEWSEEDNQWFLETIDSVVWARTEKDIGAEKVAQMKKIMGFPSD